MIRIFCGKTTTTKAECIYDVTYYFANKYLKVGDRTVDQMVQAARSGKQNLAEGNIDGITSREMELTLTNVNRASLHELLPDYEDYLRVRGLEQWDYDDPRCVQTRAFCKAHLDSAIYREKIKERSDETMIKGLIEWKKRDFLEKGGIKEEMYKARKDWQKRNGAYGKIPYEGHGYNRQNGQNRQNGNGQTTSQDDTSPSQPIKPTDPNKQK